MGNENYFDLYLNNRGTDYSDFLRKSNSWKVSYPQNNYTSLWSKTNLTTSSTNTNKEETYEEYKARIEKEVNAKLSEIKTAKNTVTSETGAKLNISEEELTDLRNSSKKELEKENDIGVGSLAMQLGIGTALSAGTIRNGMQKNTNEAVTKMFYAYDKGTKGAKYQQLFNNAPITMQNAQSEMAKANKQFLKQLDKLNKSGKSTKALRKDYDKLKKIMESALKSGDAQKVAEAAEKIKVANATKYSKLLSGGTKTALAQAADVSNVKAVKGNSLLKHMGGKTSIIMGIGGAVAGLAMDYSKIKKAYEQDTSTGNKQLLQSCTKAVGSFIAYDVCSALGKKVAISMLSKAAGKIAAKVAAKGAGKAIGLALGSLVPGIGTVAGIIVGAGVDFAVKKWVIPAIFGKNDIIDNKEIDNKSADVLLKEAYTKHLQGGKLDEKTLAILQKNPEFCASIEKQLQEEAAKATMAA